MSECVCPTAFGKRVTAGHCPVHGYLETPTPDRKLDKLMGVPTEPHLRLVEEADVGRRA